MKYNEFLDYIVRTMFVALMFLAFTGIVYTVAKMISQPLAPAKCCPHCPGETPGTELDDSEFINFDVLEYDSAEAELLARGYDDAEESFLRARGIL